MTRQKEGLALEHDRPVEALYVKLLGLALLAYAPGLVDWLALLLLAAAKARENAAED